MTNDNCSNLGLVVGQLLSYDATANEFSTRTIVDSVPGLRWETLVFNISALDCQCLAVTCCNTGHIRSQPILYHWRTNYLGIHLIITPLREQYWGDIVSNIGCECYRVTHDNCLNFDLVFGRLLSQHSSANHWSVMTTQGNESRPSNGWRMANVGKNLAQVSLHARYI